MKHGEKARKRRDRRVASYETTMTSSNLTDTQKKGYRKPGSLKKPFSIR